MDGEGIMWIGGIDQVMDMGSDDERTGGRSGKMRIGILEGGVEGRREGGQERRNGAEEESGGG